MIQHLKEERLGTGCTFGQSLPSFFNLEPRRRNKFLGFTIQRFFFFFKFLKVKII